MSKNVLEDCHPDNEDFLEGQLSALKCVYEFIFEDDKGLENQCIAHTPIECNCSRCCKEESCVKDVVDWCICSKCK